jgi:DnaJ like chaperone protein
LSLTRSLQIHDDNVAHVRNTIKELEDNIVPTVSRAYELLGVAESASDADVKQAYRRMVSKLHPDRLIHSATQREVKLAGQQMAECREALEVIQATR